MAELIKKTLVIAGIPGNKKVVKFKDAVENGMADKWYDTADKVQNLDLSKYGIESGATVEKNQVLVSISDPPKD